MKKNMALKRIKLDAKANNYRLLHHIFFKTSYAVAMYHTDDNNGSLFCYVNVFYPFFVQGE